VATFRPFSGLRYDAGVVGDPAAVTAPPYDVIDPAQRDRLYAQSPYNVVRIDLSRDPDPYGSAAATLESTPPLRASRTRPSPTVSWIWATALSTK